jgi:hypothetical protein
MFCGRIVVSNVMPNKFLQSEQITLSCLLLAQKPRQRALSAEERRYVPL